MDAVGVIGLGVVGDAFYRVLGFFNPKVYGYDVDPKRSPDTFEDVVGNAKVIFLCLPTPTREDGSQDLLALEEVCGQLAAFAYGGVVCVRSTVVPGTTRLLGIDYGLRVVHCPEFLTAANPIRDTFDQHRVMIGGDREADISEVMVAIRAIQTVREVYTYSMPETTELAKYMHNAYLATKVGFFNAMSELADQAEIDFQGALDAMLACTKATQPNHTRVPGPDGQLGFGGMCFPKDVRALLHYGKEQGRPMEQLAATIAANARHRGGVV